MSIRYTLRHNIPSANLAEEDVNDSSTWDLNLLRKHELAETDNHDIVYRKHDGEVVNWAEAATQQANEILEEVQGISSNIDNQVTLVESRLAEIEEEAVTLTEEAEAANEAAQAALVQAELAVTESQGSAESANNSSVRASEWAVKTDGLVDDIDYSSKYYAQQAGASASSASSSASTATSAKNNAQTSATNASNSATLAQQWATKTDGKVDSTDYSAKHYALSCVDSATSASQSATSAATSASTATTKASEASTSASTASTKASEASASATSASNSATTATTKASEASASATSASQSATSASTSATNASASATSAQASADAAEQAREDIQAYYGLPVGYEYFTTNPNIPQGSLPLFGGEYSRVIYRDLWNWVQQQTGYLKTEAEWQALSTSNNGNVPFYSDGDGSTTFRVPSLHCWIKGSDGSAQLVGSYLQAGLPNITGSIGNIGSVEGSHYGLSLEDTQFNGAFYLGDTTDLTNDFTISSVTPLNKKRVMEFNASRSSAIYGNANTVQPESIVGMWLVKCYGTVVDTGTIDEKAYMDEQLALNVPVGCVQAYAGQTTPQGWLLCDGSAISRTQYSRLFGVIGTTYGAGDGTDTFNLPNLTDKFIQGNAVAGTEHSAGLPNITGDVSGLEIKGWSGTSGGAFSLTKGTGFCEGSGTVEAITVINFSAKNSNIIYGNSDTVQPPSVTMRYIIKY